MDLRAQEWRDAVLIRYRINPPDLLENCDDCGVVLSIPHALDCNKGGLVTAWHNDLHHGVSELDYKALTTSHVHDNPLIKPGCAVRIGRSIHANYKIPSKQPGTVVDFEKWGGLIIRDLWYWGMGCMLDMQVINMDAKSHQKWPLEKCLATEEWQRNSSILNPTSNRNSNSPHLWHQSTACSAWKLKPRWSNWLVALPQNCNNPGGYVRIRVFITLICTTHNCNGDTG